jgi:hypothetical protein
MTLALIGQCGRWSENAKHGTPFGAARKGESAAKASYRNALAPQGLVDRTIESRSRTRQRQP